MIQDLEIHTNQQAVDRNLTTGLTHVSGKGDRIMLIGAGGKDGWVNYDIIERTAIPLTIKMIWTARSLTNFCLRLALN